MGKLTLFFVWAPVLAFLATLLVGLVLPSMIIGKLRQLIENG